MATHIRPRGWHVLVRQATLPKDHGKPARSWDLCLPKNMQTPYRAADVAHDSQMSMQVEDSQVTAPGSSTTFWKQSDSASLQSYHQLCHSLHRLPCHVEPAPQLVLPPDPGADLEGSDDSSVQYKCEYWAVSKAYGVWCQGCNQRWSHGGRFWRCKTCSLCFCTMCKPTAPRRELPRGLHMQDETRGTGLQDLLQDWVAQSRCCNDGSSRHRDKCTARLTGSESVT